MSKRSGVATLAFVAAFLAAPGGASAATEVGNTCVANNTLSNFMLIQLKNAAPAPPLAVPSAGVVTEWKLRIPDGEPAVIPQKLKVFRAVDSPSELDFTIVGESSPEAVVGGLNTFDARIPVAAGDRFGNIGPIPGKSLYCASVPMGNVMGVFPLDQPIGSSASFGVVEVPAQVPVSAIVEPDADGDGFGDETQDKCPQSKSIQTECAPLVLDSVLTPGKTSISAFVSSSIEAPITVSGVVRVAKPKKKAKSSASKQIKLKPTTQTVGPGKIGKFKLNYPAALLSALKSLPSSKSAKATITLEGANQAGVPANASSTAKIKGQLKKKSRQGG